MSDDENNQKMGKVIDMMLYLEKRISTTGSIDDVTAREYKYDESLKENGDDDTCDIIQDTDYLCNRIRYLRDRFKKKVRYEHDETLFAKIKRCCGLVKPNKEDEEQIKKKIKEIEAVNTAKKLVCNALIMYDAMALTLGVILNTNNFDLKDKKRKGYNWFIKLEMYTNSIDKAYSILKTVDIGNQQLDLILKHRIEELTPDHPVAAPRLYNIVKYDTERIYSILIYKSMCELKERLTSTEVTN